MLHRLLRSTGGPSVARETALVKRDEKRKPDAEHQRRDEEMTIGEYGFCC
jgi:hypothetical protein